MEGVSEHRHLNYSDLTLKAQVRVQSFPDFSLRIKIENPSFVWDNAEVKLTEDAIRSLKTPFLVHLKGGLAKSLFVSKDEPIAITNIKKSLLSHMQLETSKVNTIDDPNQKSFMKTGEDESIHGKCKSYCEVVRMSPEEGIKLEQTWAEEQRKANFSFTSDEIYLRW